MEIIEKWKVFEVSVNGLSSGNPYTEHYVKAVFSSKNETKHVSGFYDGLGIYKVRFMPSFVGIYNYEIISSAFEKVEGSFECVAASADNHGPVRVCSTYHFSYSDGTPYYPLGTTCYVWHLQNDEVISQTYDELKKGYFNKIRFCIFPKHYHYNLSEPPLYPYEFGKQEGLDEKKVITFNRTYPPVENPVPQFNHYNFNPKYFQRIDDCIQKLDQLGIEADLIIMHPYDRWGFSKMTSEANDLYLRYLVSRYSAYKNVWWSLANEYDLMPWNTISDWEHFASIISEEDAFNRLRNIHNCGSFYDHTRPWITHACLQRQDLYRHVEYTDEYRTKFGKGIIWDEIAYEGNIDLGWGNISGQELIRRFWEAAMRGGYAGHGETYQHPQYILWWSHGGKLHGEAPERIKFIRRILEETPGSYLKRGDGLFDETVAVPDILIPQSLYEIHYFGFGRPSYRMFNLDANKAYRVEVIDTWNMTIDNAGIFSGCFRVDLPGREYMAVRIIELQ